VNVAGARIVQVETGTKAVVKPASIVIIVAEQLGHPCEGRMEHSVADSQSWQQGYTIVSI
jgi:hypothetical protein